MIDFAFLGAISFFALIAITFKVRDYHLINTLLAAKFALFIGIYQIALYSGIDGGAWEDQHRLILDLIFGYLFYRIKGYYLSFLCVFMAIFHLTTTLPPHDYKIIMICFQALQLMCAVWGVVSGLTDRVFSRFNWAGSNSPRHS